MRFRLRTARYARPHHRGLVTGVGLDEDRAPPGRRRRPRRRRTARAGRTGRRRRPRDRGPARGGAGGASSTRGGLSSSSAEAAFGPLSPPACGSSAVGTSRRSTGSCTAAGGPISARVWASAHGLDPDRAPKPAGDDLFDLLDGGSAAGGDGADPDAAVRPDGYLRPDVLDPSWATSERRFRSVAAALTDARRPPGAAAAGARPASRGRRPTPSPPRPCSASSSSATGCRSTAAAAEDLIAAVGRAAAGRRRRTPHGSAASATPGSSPTLPVARAPTCATRRRCGTCSPRRASPCPNTRKWVLEPFRQTHPLVDALLEWRKDERIATTYGYRWLDEHVGPDGRLRGGWTACDGAAGRMTAQNGLHNLPAPLRPAVVRRARARLRPRRPRPDRASRAGRRLRRPGVRRGDPRRRPLRPGGGQARHRAQGRQGGRARGDVRPALRRGRARPSGTSSAPTPWPWRCSTTRMPSGVARRPLRTFGGAGRINLDAGRGRGSDDGGRGRFARNAVIQGSAAELFKAWAATVRHVTAPDGRSDRAVPPRRAARARAGGAAPTRWPTPSSRCLDDSAAPVGRHRGGPLRRRHQRHPPLVRRQGEPTQSVRSGGAEAAAVSSSLRLRRPR